MSVKQLLYFSGLVPTVLGGSYFGHWFGQDKTIGDALRRIGKKPFENKEDFQSVYNKYKNSEGFTKTIPSATSWESVVKWCNWGLGVELNEKSVKELLPKVERYCTEFKEIVVEDNDLPNFGGLMQIINDNAVTTNGAKREGVLAFVYDGSYYCAEEVENVGNSTKFEKCSKPRNFYSLYIPEEYGLISKFNNDSKWDSLVEKYLKSEKKLGIELKKTISVRNSQGQLVQQENVRNSHNRNAMMQYCYNNLLRRQIRDPKVYRETLETAISWCTDHGLSLDEEFEFPK